MSGRLSLTILLHENDLNLPVFLRPLMLTSIGPKVRFGGQQMWYYSQGPAPLPPGGADSAPRALFLFLRRERISSPDRASYRAP
eukprot:gene11276-15097_t